MDEALLARVPLFATLPCSERRYLAATLRVVTAPAGAILCREGESGDRCYVVAAGHLDVIKAWDTPDEHLIATHGPGEVIGELSLFNRDRRRTATVRCRDAALRPPHAEPLRGKWL